MATRWQIVGGTDRGGVLVREALELSSAKAPERLSQGATVEELELVGERLHYRRLTGTGPSEGWISIALEHRPLAVRLESEEVETAAAPLVALADAPASEQEVGKAAIADGPASPSDTAIAGEEAEKENGSDAEWEAYLSAPRSANGGDHVETDWEAEAESRRWAALPQEAEAELKWFVWNQLWRKVNGKFAAQASTALEREVRARQAQDDAERMHVHYRAVEQTRTLSKRTLRHIKRQAEVVGDAVAAGAKEGKWMLVAWAKALDPPAQLEASLWNELVVACRSAGVAIFFMARGSGKSPPHLAYFEERWERLKVREGD